MKILIVSGFLGAGKTTFIKALAKHTGKEFAILENEYGAAGIDKDRLETELASGTVNIWEMTEGCICCSAKGDFALSVLSIANAVDPEYLVIEPTGVGKLGNIVENLKQIEYDRITLLAPVTVVDIHSYRRYLQEYPELYQNQIAEAGTILVSKTEQASAEEKQQIFSALCAINPTAQIITDHYSLLASDEWLHLLEKGHDGFLHHSPFSEASASADSEQLPDSFTLKHVHMRSPESLFLFLEDLIRGYFGNVFRAKGQLPAGDTWLQFDVADSRYSIIDCEQAADSEVVFIGTDIHRQPIRRLCMTKITAGRRYSRSAFHRSVPDLED